MLFNPLEDIFWPAEMVMKGPLILIVKKLVELAWSLSTQKCQLLSDQ